MCPCCCPWATPHDTGATSWPTNHSRTPRWGSNINEQGAQLIGPWLDALEVARDSTHEGFDDGPKFPPSPMLETLVLPASRDGELSARAAGLLTATLDAMVTGALHDHVGGELFRYSVTPDWSLPQRGVTP